MSDPGVEPFRLDVQRLGGYQYATGERLSSRLANARVDDAALAIADFEGRRVIDIGCGDGTYTVGLARRARPATMVGVDPAPEAIEVARGRDTGIRFRVGSAYELPYEADEFDIALFRGVLHHLERPQDAIREAFRVARQLVVTEPNGLAPALKMIERVSRYHREHRERSFTSWTLDRWVRAAGGAVGRRSWVCLVPMFAPDWLARVAKAVEPVIEASPGVRRVACAAYVFEASRPAR